MPSRRGRSRRRRVRSGTRAQAGSLQEPPRGGRSPRDPGTARRALVRDVLRADERRLRAVEATPAPVLLEHVPVPDDAPEVAVRAEEHEVPAAVAVPLDQVVLTCRHVLVVPCEDDEVVRAAKRVGARDVLEVPLREDVDAFFRPRQPMHEAEVEAQAVRHSAVEECASEPDRVQALARRTTSRPFRRRRRLGSCTPARSAWGGRPQRAPLRSDPA